MKKLVLMLTLLTLTLTAYSQHYVTKFLGIPVDGSKSGMIRKLKAKHFKNALIGYDLEGEFNGTKVNIAVATNKKKVWRVMVADAVLRDEQQIKLRFNNLYNQFSNNNRYIKAGGSTISDNEDISYEMTVNKKEYQAAFIQWPTDEEAKSLSDEAISNLNRDAYKRIVWFTINKDETDYKILMYYDNVYNDANGEDL